MYSDTQAVNDIRRVVQCYRRIVTRHVLPFTVRRGSTLLLALLVMSSFLATALTIGTFVITQLRSVRAVDNAVLASYAAESSIEDILFRVRRDQQFDGFATAGTLPNGTTWRRTVADEVTERFLTLTKDATEQLDLFPASGEITADIGVKSLVITAVDRARGAAGTEDAWLEVTWVPWLASGAWADSSGRALRGPSELAADTVIDLTQHPTNEPAYAYRVRFTALQADLGSVRIQAASDTSGATLVSFPSGIRAIATGVSGGVQFAERAEFPARIPLAPTFNYVVFSGCDIVKDGPPSCP